MSAHRLPRDWVAAPWRISDPGASGTFNLDNKGRALALITTAAAETRTVPAPDVSGQELILALDTDGGDCTITVTGGNGVSTIVLDDAGDSVCLVSITVAGTAKWKVSWQQGASDGATGNFADVVVNDTMLVGASSAVTVSNGDGATDLIPNAQILGTTKTDSSLLLGSFNTTDTGTVAPTLAFLKSGHATLGSNTTVASGEVLGEINWYGADGTDFESPAARIQCLADAAVGTGDMPGRLVFLTTADGGETLTEAMRITSSQDVRINDASGLIVGSTSAQITISDGDGATNLIPEVQILGTTKTDGSLLLMVNSATATSAAAPSVNLVKSAHATLGSNTVVASGEVLGEVNFFGADGTDFESCAVSIRGICNTTPGTGDMPGRLSVFTSTDGAETPTERVRITGTATASTLALGVAGATTGTITLAGTTSGVVTIQAAAAAGAYSLTLPPDDGDAGEQLQTDGSGVLTFEAAGSLRAVKNVIAEVSHKAEETLAKLCGTGVYEFNYRDKEPDGSRVRFTTGDKMTVYTGVMAEELPEVMHHNGKIFSPVSAFGELLLAIKALNAKVDRLAVQP